MATSIILENVIRKGYEHAPFIEELVAGVKHGAVDVFKGQKVMPIDPYVQLPFRFLGYGCAASMALRYRFCDDLINALHLTATGYVLCHAFYKASQADLKPVTAFVDTLMFEALASIIIPTAVTWIVCTKSREYLKEKKELPKQLYKWGPLTLGMSMLPVIAKSLDALVNHLMSSTIRVFY